MLLGNGILPLENDIDILSFLDLQSVMNVLLLSKLNYRTFNNFLLRHPHPYFHFADTRLLHRAIMLNKFNILKWLIVNNILQSDHGMLCQYYKRIYDPPCCPCFHQERIDISLALACQFASDKVFNLLIQNGPITNSLKFNYIEYHIGDQNKKLHIEKYMQLKDNPNQFSYKKSLHIKHQLSNCEYYQFFIDALNKYRLTGYWDLAIILYSRPDTC